METFTFTVKNINTGETSPVIFNGKNRDDARNKLETYLFRTAQRNYEIID